mgnify:CR=1 FL=1
MVFYGVIILSVFIIGKRRIKVSYNDIDGDVHCSPVTLRPDTFSQWKSGQNIIRLLQPDGVAVYTFDDITGGGEYRAVCDTDSRKLRDQNDDKILEIEATQAVLEAMKSEYPDAHVHHNLMFGKKLSELKMEVDGLVHGHVHNPTIACMVDCKYNPRDTDVDKVLARSKKLLGYIENKEVFPFSKSGTLLDKAVTVPFNHFHNVNRVVPCLGGKLFHKDVIEYCHKKGVFPVYPSGARYCTKAIKSFLKHL